MTTRFSLPEAEYAADIRHCRRSNHHAGRSKQASNGELPCWERMLDRSSSSLDRRSGVLSSVPGALKTLSAFGPVDFLLSEAKFETWVSLARCRSTAVLQSERTGLANMRVKAGDEACGSTRFHWHCLPIGTGNGDRFALFIGGEVKLRQAEFVSRR